MSAQAHTHRQVTLWTADGAEVEDGILLTRGQLQEWAGATLTDGALAKLADALPAKIQGKVSELAADVCTFTEDDQGNWHAVGWDESRPAGDKLIPFVTVPDTEVLLCDECWEAATGLLAECQDGCNLSLSHHGECGPYPAGMRSQDRCDNCGTIGRLTRTEIVNIGYPEKLNLLTMDNADSTWSVVCEATGEVLARFGTEPLCSWYIAQQDGADSGIYGIDAPACDPVHGTGYDATAP